MCVKREWEEGGVVATGDDDSGLRGRSVRMSEHGVKVCVMSRWPGGQDWVCFCLLCECIIGL